MNAIITKLTIVTTQQAVFISSSDALPDLQQRFAQFLLKPLLVLIALKLASSFDESAGRWSGGKSKATSVTRC